MLCSCLFKVQPRGLSVYTASLYYFSRITLFFSLFEVFLVLPLCASPAWEGDQKVCRQERDQALHPLTPTGVAVWQYGAGTVGTCARLGTETLCSPPPPAVLGRELRCLWGWTQRCQVTAGCRYLSPSKGRVFGVSSALPQFRASQPPSPSPSANRERAAARPASGRDRISWEPGEGCSESLPSLPALSSATLSVRPPRCSGAGWDNGLDVQLSFSLAVSLGDAVPGGAVTLGKAFLQLFLNAP